GTQTGWTLTLPDDSVEKYTLSGQISSIKTRNGLTTALGYNTRSLLTTVTGPFGQALSFQYDTLNRLTTLIVPDGNVFNYTYDQYNNLRSVTLPDGYQRMYGYSNPLFVNLMTSLYDENG